MPAHLATLAALAGSGERGAARRGAAGARPFLAFPARVCMHEIAPFLIAFLVALGQTHRMPPWPDCLCLAGSHARGQGRALAPHSALMPGSPGLPYLDHSSTKQGTLSLGGADAPLSWVRGSRWKGEGPAAFRHTFPTHPAVEI